MKLKEINLYKNVSDSLVDLHLNQEVQARKVLEENLGERVIINDWHGDVFGYLVDVSDIFVYRIVTPRGDVLNLHYHDLYGLHIVN